MIKYELNLSVEDMFAPVVKVVAVEELQAKDFAAWLRKQARLFGRKAEIATTAKNAVEVWLAELGLGSFSFLAGSEIWDGLNEYWASDFQVGMYMTDDEGNMILTIGEWLKLVDENERPENYLIAR